MSLQEMEGDLFNSDTEVIVHQCNCLTVRAHGLSQSLAEKFPQANVYATRKPIGTRNLAVEEDRGIPGTIRVFTSQTPVVICLLAQWDYGRASHRPKRISTYEDTPQNRENWFQTCLQELGNLPYKTFGFPYKIGCNLGGGNWTHYRQYIEQFAHTYDKHVYIFHHT
ncbi:uncharacterized protein LOC134242661 [Saccostrea cucullata]|uniref:uncharacterized protein LOC134242661 n=1 Tax=Saccostrea cuccullata TaxID=36930 RepID=UPI002ED3AB9A